MSKKPKYDMVCVKPWQFDVQIGDKCRILDFERCDYYFGGMRIALEFEKYIGGIRAGLYFPDANGKDGHCWYVDLVDMKYFKFIDEV